MTIGIIASVIAIITAIIGGYYIIILSIWFGRILFYNNQDDISRLKFDLLTMEEKGKFTYYPVFILFIIIPFIEHLLNSTIYSLFIVFIVVFYFMCLQIQRSEKTLMIEIKNEDKNIKAKKWYLILQTDNDEYIFSKYIPVHKTKGLKYNKPKLNELKLDDLKSFSKQELINYASKYVYISEIPKVLD